MKEMEIFSQANNVKIEFKSKENLPPIFPDPLQTELAVENLLDNAIKFTNKGIVDISVEKHDNEEEKYIKF